jgi:aspartyl-tRNA(Asn)/glutamyl-tRNA(Gln) amidotransferase subunit A
LKPSPQDVAFLPVTELARHYRAGTLSPVEVTALALERAERLGGPLRAFVTVTGDLAMAQARRAENELRAGQDRGPLHGVPYALKDVVDTAGVKTTFGARPFALRVPERDADVVERLREAGAVLVGKTACIELAGALGCTAATASLTGAARNPWDAARWAGGSSGGSAAAVAAGVVPFAIGTETLGSTMGPAAFCGVTGLRPTYDLVSRRGVMPFAYTMDKIGVLARTAEGAAAVLAAIRDDRAKPRPARRGGLLHVDPTTARGLRIGLVTEGLEQAEPTVGILLQAAIAQLERLGMAVREIAIPQAPYREVSDVIATAEARDAFDDLLRTGRVAELDDPVHRTERQDYHGAARAADYVRAMRLRSVIQRAWAELYDDVDLVLAANAPIEAPPAEGPLPFHGPPDVLRIPTNLAGLPGIALPMGFSGGALPMSLQLVGPAWSERRVLSAAAAFQSVTSWHTGRPRIA